MSRSCPGIAGLSGPTIIIFSCRFGKGLDSYTVWPTHAHVPVYIYAAHVISGGTRHYNRFQVYNQIKSCSGGHQCGLGPSSTHGTRPPLLGGCCGVPVSMRMHQVGEASALKYIRCVMRAHLPYSQCYNHHKFNGPPHSRVPLVPPPQKSCVNVYCRHSTVNGRQCMGGTLYRSYILWGHCPPKQIVWGQIPPPSPPPGPTAYVCGYKANALMNLDRPCMWVQWTAVPCTWSVYMCSPFSSEYCAYSFLYTGTRKGVGVSLCLFLFLLHTHM